MKATRFQNIDEADLDVILDIYNYYIKTTTATFRPEPVTIDVLKTFIFLDHPKYNWFHFAKTNAPYWLSVLQR